MTSVTIAMQLLYQARLRMPSSSSETTRKEAVEDVITMVGGSSFLFSIIFQHFIHRWGWLAVETLK